MSLADAHALINTAARIPKQGRIIDIRNGDEALPTPPGSTAHQRAPSRV